jgi:hypothetical protein
MTAPHADDIIEGYLARLTVALGGADPATTAEVQGGVRSHIVEARSMLIDESDADILNLLDRLGEPSVLAAEAAGSSRQLAAPKTQETIPRSATLAVGLLLIGGIASSFLGPFTLVPAVALLIIALWFARTSGRWSDREVLMAGLVAVLFTSGVALLVALLAIWGPRHWWIVLLIFGPGTSLLASAAYLGLIASRGSRRLSLINDDKVVE